MNCFKNHLEVIFKYHKSKISAFCTAFPNCKGAGEDKKTALHNLSKSIAKFVSQLTEKKIKEILLSENYSEVILDVSHKNTKEEKKIFYLNSPLINHINNSMLLKIKTSAITESLDNLNINETLDEKQSYAEELDLSAYNIDNKKTNRLLINNQEDMYFGFPLSFN
ncbi:hypothetical protein HOC37_05550 [bacterium]|nr:hypothetical protein [bacterium]MBT4552427.1 hypothetical protein [bacterium]MBT7088034.1 hypothetical protein [bacterium]